jgi:hypothetical protein
MLMFCEDVVGKRFEDLFSDLPRLLGVFDRFCVEANGGITERLTTKSGRGWVVKYHSSDRLRCFAVHFSFPQHKMYASVHVTIVCHATLGLTVM